MTLEDVLAAAIRWPEVMRRLAPVLTSDLVVANVFHRQIMEFAADFHDQYDSLPKQGDWQAWIEDLSDQDRDAVREQLRKLLDRDLSSFTPSFIIDHSGEALRNAAAGVAIGRLQRASDEGRAEALMDLAGQVEALSGHFSNFSNLRWPDRPVHLGAGEPEPFPTHILPAWVRAQVENVAAHTQTPTDLPLLLALSAIGATVANKATVEIRPGHEEPAILWTAAILPSGARKSPAFRHLIDRHVLALEDELARETASDRERDASEIRALNKARKDAEKELARVLTDPDLGAEDRAEREEALREQLEALSDRRRELGPTTPPRLAVSGDVTSERLPQIMQENHGRIAVLAPEAGDLFRILSGLYSGSPVIGIWKRAWTGSEKARDDRVGREGSYVRKPAITMGVTFQPGVLEEIERKRTLRGEGLLARPLYAIPDTDVGYRKTGADIPGLDPEVDETWNTRLRQLHGSEPAATDPEGDWEPHRLRLSPGAQEIFFAFEEEVERMLRPGGRLEYCRDFGSKLHGQAARVALLLHAALQVGEGMDPWEAPVSERAMRGGVEIARTAVSHALRVFNVLEIDPRVHLGRYLLRRLLELSEEDGAPPTQSEVHEAVKGKVGLETADALNRVVRILEAHGWIQRVERPSPGRGRKPSPWVVLHPDAPKFIRLIRRKTVAANKSNSSNAKGGIHDQDPEANKSNSSNAEGGIHDQKSYGLDLDAIREKVRRRNEKEEQDRRVRRRVERRKREQED